MGSSGLMLMPVRLVVVVGDRRAVAGLALPRRDRSPFLQNQSARQRNEVIPAPSVSPALRLPSGRVVPLVLMSTKPIERLLTQAKHQRSAGLKPGGMRARGRFDPPRGYGGD
jgi:hypothetical protein